MNSVVNRRAVRPCVLWFTGLSGSGKSTIAERVVHMLERAGTPVEYLDGDRVRSVFPSTGFTREERDQHIRRIGFLASLLEKHGVTVVASFVSPYRDARAFVRKLCRNFVEIHVATPLAECERRDVKGLYAKARRGEIKMFTGISDPYEPPRKPELTIDTTAMSVEEACDVVMRRAMGKCTSALCAARSVVPASRRDRCAGASVGKGRSASVSVRVRPCRSVRSEVRDHKS